jgi:hypothetical protein
MAFAGIKRFSVMAAVGASVIFAAYVGWLSARDLTPNAPYYLISTRRRRGVLVAQLIASYTS